MKKMTPKERFLYAMRCEEVDRPPVCGMTTTATTELMDYTGAAWPEAHKSGKAMAKLALGAPEFLRLESVRVPFCLSYEAEALGCTVDLGKKNSTPMIKSSPFRNTNDPQFETMDEKTMLKTARMPAVIESAEIIVREKGAELPTLLGVTGPFTISGHLAGTENLILWTLTEPDMAKAFTKYSTEYMKMWLTWIDNNLGVDTIQMSEPTASWDMISPEMFDEFALDNLKAVYKPMKKVMKVLHICGNMLPMLEHMVAAGSTGLSVEEKTDPYEAVKLVNKRAALVGNVGVVKPLLQGTTAEVKAGAERSLDAGFNILSAACGMSALIKKENVWAMVETGQNWKK